MLSKTSLLLLPAGLPCFCPALCQVADRNQPIQCISNCCALTLGPAQQCDATLRRAKALKERMGLTERKLSARFRFPGSRSVTQAPRATLDPHLAAAAAAAANSNAANGSQQSQQPSSSAGERRAEPAGAHSAAGDSHLGLAGHRVSRPAHGVVLPGLLPKFSLVSRAACVKVAAGGNNSSRPQPQVHKYHLRLAASRNMRPAA